MRRSFGGILKTTASSKPPWRTPDHPPYSQMVEVALRGLSEEGGSTESSISAFIQSNFSGLPWGHDRLLPYYLGKLVVSGEVCSPSHDRYQLPVYRSQFLPRSSSLGRRRGGPLYRTNPSSFPTFYSPRSSQPRRRGRPRLLSSRVKCLKDSAEGTPPLQHEQKSKPSRGSVSLRGRLRLPREGAVGKAAARTLLYRIRIRKPRGSRVRKDGSRASKLSNNGGGENAALDNQENFPLTHAQSSPEKTPQLLPPEEFPSLPVSSPELLEFPEHFQGPFDNGDMLNFSSKVASFSDAEKTVGSETCALDDFQQPELCDGGEGQPFVAAHFFEHVEGLVAPVRESPLLTPEPVKMLSFLTPELLERKEGKSPQEEVPSSPVLELARLREEQSSPTEGLPLLHPEMPEIGIDGPSKSEDSFEKLSPRKRTALVALEQGALDPLPLPDGDEIEGDGLSAKREKRRRRRKGLRLWFEG